MDGTGGPATPHNRTCLIPGASGAEPGRRWMEPAARPHLTNDALPQPVRDRAGGPSRDVPNRSRPAIQTMRCPSRYGTGRVARVGMSQTARAQPSKRCAARRDAPSTKAPTVGRGNRTARRRRAGSIASRCSVHEGPDRRAGQPHGATPSRRLDRVAMLRHRRVEHSSMKLVISSVTAPRRPRTSEREPTRRALFDEAGDQLSDCAPEASNIGT